MSSGKGKDERGVPRSRLASQRSDGPSKALAGTSGWSTGSGGSGGCGATGNAGNPSSVVIPLSQDKSQRSLFSLTKVVRLGKAQTAVSFSTEDLESCRSKLEEASTGKFELLNVLRRLGCYRLCMEDLRGSGLGGIVRVLSLVHPKDEVREAAGRLLGRWKRIVLREIFPLPRPAEVVLERKDVGTTGIEGCGVNNGKQEDDGARNEQREHSLHISAAGGVKGALEGQEDAGNREEPEETYGYDVETARNAPEGTEVAPDALIRMEEEEAAYERMMERKMRVEADPFCSSSSDDEEGCSESDMWSPGMDRKRRARERARLHYKKNQGVKRSKPGKDGEGGEDEDEETNGETPKANRPEKPRLSRAFMNLFAGSKKKKESENELVVLNEGSGRTPDCVETEDKAAEAVVVELTDDTR